MKTMRSCGLFWMVLLVTGSAFADAAADKAVSKHCLWEVRGGSNVVYLVGSIHFLKPENYPLAAPIEAAYSNSLVVAFETDIGEMEDAATQLKMMSKARMPAGETWQQELTPETYHDLTNQVAQTIGQNPMSLMVLQSLTPVMVAVTIAEAELLKMGANPSDGVDLFFYHRAVRDKKQLVAFETVDFQIGLVTEFSKAESEAMVKSTLKEMASTRKFFSDMLAAWQNGDAAQMEKLLNDGMDDFPAVFKRFVTDRNQRWIPKIEELSHGGKNAAVIVGAGHLVGPDGVVELLRKKGYRVTQL